MPDRQSVSRYAGKRCLDFLLLILNRLIEPLNLRLINSYLRNYCLLHLQRRQRNFNSAHYLAIEVIDYTTCRSLFELRKHRFRSEDIV